MMMGTVGFYVLGWGTGTEVTVAVGLTTLGVLFLTIVLLELLTIEAWNMATECASANCFLSDST
jgi:hypothetical protein